MLRILALSIFFITTSALADVGPGDYFVGGIRSSDDTSMRFEDDNRIKYCTYDGCGNFKYRIEGDGAIHFRTTVDVTLRENSKGDLTATFAANSGNFERDFRRRTDPYANAPVYPISYEPFVGDWGGKRTVVKVLSKTRLEYCYAGECKQYKYKRSGNRYRINLGSGYWIEFHRLEFSYELTYYDAAQDKFYYINLRQ